MVCLEERHPQNENFVCVCLADAKNEHFNSAFEKQFADDCCQLSTASNAEKAGVQKPCRSCCDADCSANFDLECGYPDGKLIVEMSEKDCRICSNDLEGYGQELGKPIALGCSCNGDLAFAHQKCAEKWFKIKGNMTCEICGSTAKNLVGYEKADHSENSIKSGNNAVATNETQDFLHGQRLIACILGVLMIVILLCLLLPQKSKS